MWNLLKMTKSLKTFKSNEDGNITATFAISSVVLLGAIGAAMDFTTLSNADARSQAIADQIALSAAVYVKDYGGEPLPAVGTDGTIAADQGSTVGYLDRKYKIYTAAELGHNFKGWVEGGSENVRIELEYDDANSQVTAKVSGKTKATFVELLGKHDLGFSAKSTAKYELTTKFDPASVVMVLDNSGSMSFDDKPLFFDHDANRWARQENTSRRIDALREHATSFIDDLTELAGDQSADEDKVLRTGLLAYNTAIIPNRTVPLRWDTSAVTSSLDNMTAIGGTNSAPPISTARSWMSLEDNIHENIHGEEPLKFLIFMTDGVNTSGGVTWVPEEGTGQWYGQVCRLRWNNGNCRWYQYDTVESETQPTEGRFWQEGRWVPTANIASTADCDAMKNDGVEIYTIGFALSSGWYDTNGFFGTGSTTFVNPDVRDQAYNFLAECASSPDKFLTAENADELNQAFERIGTTIQSQIIRLSN